MSVEIVQRCRNAECKVATTGKCVEGLALTACPHILNAAETAVQIQNEKNEPKLEVKKVKPVQPNQLISGEKLTVEGASALLKRGNARILAIIGPIESGKTSMVGALFELFQKGSVESYSFAGSHTLLSFDQICHDVRTASGRHEADMEHTGRIPSTAGISFFHLCVKDKNTSVFTDLLIGDRTGEEYSSTADDISITNDFVEIHSAESLLFLVNGAQLLDSRTRESVKSNIVMIFQGLVNGEAVHKAQRVLVVLTKLDVIAADEAKKAKTIETFDKLVENIQNLFGRHFAEIKSLKIAASPKSPIFPFGYELEKVLQFWAATEARANEPVSIPPITSNRVIGNFRHENKE